MTPPEQVAAFIISEIGCAWIIATTAISFLAQLLLNSFTFETTMKMAQEFTLCLGHIIVMTCASHVNYDILCKVTSLMLQYCFNSYSIFLLLESSQTYSLYTNVILRKGIMPKKLALMIGLGFPGAIVAITGAFGHSSLASDFSCFVNYDSLTALGSVLPQLITYSLAAIFTESSGLDELKEIPGKSKYQMHAATVSKYSLLPIIPLSASSWIMMTTALYYQNIFLFTAIFGINVTLGKKILTTHFIGNEKVRLLWDKFRAKYFKSPSAAKSLHTSISSSALLPIVNEKY